MTLIDYGWQDEKTTTAFLPKSAKYRLVSGQRDLTSTLNVIYSFVIDDCERKWNLHKPISAL